MSEMPYELLLTDEQGKTEVYPLNVPKGKQFSITVLDEGMVQTEHRQFPVGPIDKLVVTRPGEWHSIEIRKKGQEQRVEALASEPWLFTQAIAEVWRDHSNCNWLSDGKNVNWSCGVVHHGLIHTQPTTRDCHVAALATDHIARRLIRALAGPTRGQEDGE